LQAPRRARTGCRGCPTARRFSFGRRTVLGRHFFDDPADGHHAALVGSGADLFGAVRGPDAEIYAAALDAEDLGMADDFAPHGSCHQMPYVDARAHGALARLQVPAD